VLPCGGGETNGTVDELLEHAASETASNADFHIKRFIVLVNKLYEVASK
jgi:hypothetical protein